jgi:alpha-L-fucosidase 2
MLLHSHNEEIKLLPALPTDRWPNGHIKGLRARGDYTVDIHWANGELAEATIHAGERSEGEVRVVYKGESKVLGMKKREKASIGPDQF